MTGSTSGIGAATARRLAAEGARVVVHGRSADRAHDVAADIRAAGGDAIVVLGDLGSDAGAALIVREIEASFGGIDILVNNLGDAGAQKDDWFSVDPDGWAEAYNVNVLSCVRTVRAFVPGMKAAGWGRVVNIASGAYATPPPDFPAYGPAKAALVNLGVSLSKSLSCTGITVNTVSPGLVLTDAMRTILPQIGRSRGWEETDLAGLETRFVRDMWPNLIGRTGRPEEIAALIAYVASDLAGYTNGANFRIDGGAAGIPF
ncbi:MAG: SDR family NAD(P)-dependent oxidoreductase [Janthinobacterium lividum]